MRIRFHLGCRRIHLITTGFTEPPVPSSNLHRARAVEGLVSMVVGAVGGELVERGRLREHDAEIAHQRRVQGQHDSGARLIGRLVGERVGHETGDLHLVEPGARARG